MDIASKQIGNRAGALPYHPRTAIIAAATTRAPFALTAVSGLLFAASFPPLSVTGLAWVALVPFFVALGALPPRRAAAAGLIWTMMLAAGVAWCLPGMLTGYFGMPASLSVAGAVLIIVGLAGVYVSVFAAWVAWLVSRQAATPLLIAGGWVVCELARAHGVIANPWALSAYSQVEWAGVMQIADAAGPYGIGALLAAVNAGLAALLVPALRGRRPTRSLLVVALLFAATVAYGEWRLRQPFGDGAPLTVAVVQPGLPTTPADAPTGRAARLERHLALTRAAAVHHPDLVVWPEYGVESYLAEASAARDAVLAVAADIRADLLVGGPHFTSTDTGTRYHNSVFLVRDGRLAARYDKNRLVPFAEGGEGAWLRHAPAPGYSPGAGGAVLPARRVAAGVFLCVESMYPDFVRTIGHAGAHLLVNLSNDAWFGHSAPAQHQRDIAAVRAIENRRYLVRATATGISAVIDPHGRVVTQSAMDAPAVLTANVRAVHAQTPYQRWGDAFAWLVVAAVAGRTIHLWLGRPTHQHVSEGGTK